MFGQWRLMQIEERESPAPRPGAELRQHDFGTESGFLPSIYGGHRVGRLLAGDVLESSLFDAI